MAGTERRRLSKEVLGIANAELTLIGMQKRASLHTVRLCERFWGSVGLNVAMNRGSNAIGINPIVGVRYEGIETLIQRLVGEKRSQFAPTLSTAIGYLMPESSYVEWYFEPSPFDYAGEVKKMVAAIGTYGFPFMKAHASVEAIIDDLENKRFSFNESIVFRLPVAYFLIGKTELALQYVKERTAELGTRTDAAAEAYRTFAMNFLREAAPAQ